jgi:LEA14-like dessication related protein
LCPTKAVIIILLKPMPKGKTLVIVGLSLVAAVVAAFGIKKLISKLQSLSVTIYSASVDAQASNVNTTSVKLRIDIYNPNTEAVKFVSFLGNILYNGTNIANIDPYTNTMLTLNPRQSTSLNLRVNLPNGKLGTSFLDSITDLLNGGLKKIPITMVGELKAEGMTVPVNKDLSINLTNL